MSSIAIYPPSLHSPHRRRDSILIYLSVSGPPPSPAVPMRVLPSEPLASVKLRIRGLVGGRHHRLVFAGRDLARDHCPVQDYGVRHGDVLHLVLRVSDLREIRVQTANCGRTFVLRGRSVGFLKEEVARKAKGIVDFTGYRLFRTGEELEDWVVVGDICGDDEDAAPAAVDDDDVIHLILRRPAKVRAHAVGRDLELFAEDPEWRKNPEGKPRLEPVVANPKAELSPVLKELIRSAMAGLAMGIAPVRSPEGSGGAYFMRDESGTRCVAVFKPMDEEPMAENDPRGLPPSLNGEGLKRGTRVGEGALREVAAYVLDHPLRGRRYQVTGGEIGFSGVPPTVMIRCLHEGFNHADPGVFDYAAGDNFKMGSLQMFVRNSGSCEDVGPQFFPVQEVHKISVLDIRLANTDRHGGNILLRREGEDGRIVLVPIDHGYCLPENFEDCTFEWLYWPQAREPYDSGTVEYIKSLDAEQDIALLKFYGWELSPECARTLRISTMLLKKGVERGLTPFIIGNILCRETIKSKSMIEEIVDEAKGSALPGSSELAFVESVSQIMDRRLDELTR